MQHDQSWGELCNYSWVGPRARTPTRQYFDTIVARVGNLADLNIVDTSSPGMIRGLLQSCDFLIISSMLQIETEDWLGLLTHETLGMIGADRRIGLIVRLIWTSAGYASGSLTY